MREGVRLGEGVGVGLWVLAGLLAVGAGDEACLGQGPCTCSSSAGTIDLSPLGNTDNTPKFPDVLDDNTGTWYYSYNPCRGFSEGSCSNVAVCQTDMGSQYYDAGDASTATFVWDATNNVNMIKYTSTDSSGTTRATYVTLVCDLSQEGTLDAKGEDPIIQGQFELTLTSKYACPMSNSTTPSPTPTPTPTLPPGPDIFSLQTAVILLLVLVVGCLVQILLLVLVIVILAVKGRSVTSAERTNLLRY